MGTLVQDDAGALPGDLEYPPKNKGVRGPSPQKILTFKHCLNTIILNMKIVKSLQVFRLV